MRRASAYLTTLAGVISDDLRNHTAPDKLMFEVEAELKKQILAQAVAAIHEFNNTLLYNKHDQTAQNVAQRKMMRHLGYVSEMFTASDEVKGVIGAGSSPLFEEADFEIQA